MAKQALSSHRRVAPIVATRGDGRSTVQGDRECGGGSISADFASQSALHVRIIEHVETEKDGDGRRFAHFIRDSTFALICFHLIFFVGRRRV
jgi:hypothetical protein